MSKEEIEIPLPQIFLDDKSKDVVEYLEEQEEDDEEDVEMPALAGSPLYPHIYVGEMPKPLYSNYPDTEYQDDNIHRTYLGLMSFYG